MKTKENNKLIAEFMQYEKYPIANKSEGYKVPKINTGIIVNTCIKFRISFILGLVDACDNKNIKN